METVSAESRRKQDRNQKPHQPDINAPFENESDTDFSLLQNIRWIEEIAKKWQSFEPKPLPLVIGGKELYDNQSGIGVSPNHPDKTLYHYAKATKQHIEEAIRCAKDYEKIWGGTTVAHRSQILANVAQKMREHRGDFIGVMMIDAGKIATESDPEISEAIDFAEYYQRQVEKWAAMKDLQWTPKGTIVVTPPFNFPLAITAGMTLGALMAGNCVLLKPASDTVLVGWTLVQALWEAGIPKEALQFVPCSGDEVGSTLITDPRINSVVLTGGTETAAKFLKMRPGLDLAAELGGKNSVIITALADRDLAVKNLIHSAFSHSGQKCSAASIAILEAEVYDDPHFMTHLRNAVESMKLGLSYELSTKVAPLIHEPRGPLKTALTTLDPGEEWVLEPKQMPHNPCHWSPGIKRGVNPGSRTHMTELFGPVLSIMRADNLQHAIEIANQVPFGLTSGLESLDEREQDYWKEHIQAGNLYINRSTTGAIVQRQPFGGIKASCYGRGFKAGGPNYVCEFMKATQVGLPQEKASVNNCVNNLTPALDKVHLSAEQLGLWMASVSNYAYCWNRMKKPRDPSKIVGEDNFFSYKPRKGVVLRIEPDSNPLDALRSIAAAYTVGSELEISYSPQCLKEKSLCWLMEIPALKAIQEDERTFIRRLKHEQIKRIRMVSAPSQALKEAAGENVVLIIDIPVLANGRLELLHYLYEVSTSCAFHRYGNLGLREA
jgi:RHH-type proline utilization regulon transcriptional repressor/proline dehydrogenase/delta 1-pyrroline-5-carboxylate dehydrogenase